MLMIIITASVVNFWKAHPIALLLVLNTNELVAPMRENMTAKPSLIEEDERIMSAGHSVML